MNCSDRLCESRRRSPYGEFEWVRERDQNDIQFAKYEKGENVVPWTLFCSGSPKNFTSVKFDLKSLSAKIDENSFKCWPHLWFCRLIEWEKDFFSGLVRSGKKFCWDSNSRRLKFHLHWRQLCDDCYENCSIYELKWKQKFYSCTKWLWSWSLGHCYLKKALT